MRFYRLLQFTGIFLAFLVSPQIQALTYSYDSLNRLTAVVYDDGSEIRYEYDKVGNILSVNTTRANNSYTVGGSLSGLAAGNSVVLQNNAGDDLVVSANGNFSFSTPLADGSAYAVTVQAQPTTPNQTCVVNNGNGAISGANVTNIRVSCTTNRYTVGGTLSGLATGASLVIQNNSSDHLTLTSNGRFTFPTPLLDGGSYQVSILTQPSSPAQVCSITNGSGTLSGTNVTSVDIRCATNAYSISGTLSGLAAGNSITLVNNGNDLLTLTSNGPFTFANSVADGGAYSVMVSTQPTSPDQHCTVYSGSGTVAGGPVTNISVNCETNTVMRPQTIEGFSASPSMGTVGLSSRLSVTSSGASGNPVTFGSLSPNICTVLADQVSFLTTGICTLSANQAGNANYYSAPQVLLEVRVTTALDIDGDEREDALTDGLLILRYLLGFVGNALVNDAVSNQCGRCDATQIDNQLALLRDSGFLDVDDDGVSDAQTDGFLIIRYLFGFTGDALLQDATGGGCKRCTSSEIVEYLSSHSACAGQTTACGSMVDGRVTNILNDTGITWGGDYSDGNNTACDSNITAPQDCNQGRDITADDDSDGHAGFSFTKLAMDGTELPATATSWACVRDNVTGLIWEVKTDDGSIHDKDKTYRWGGVSAQGVSFGTYYPDWNELVDGANAEQLCGFDDWRVPNIVELHSLVDYNKTTGPMIDTDYFPQTVSTLYWSSTPYMNLSRDAWAVRFNFGFITPYFRTSPFPVRLVYSKRDQ